MSLAQGRAGRLERRKLLSQRHLVFAVNSGWVYSARLFICSRKESGWIETEIWLLLSRRGCRFELRSFDPADWSGVFFPSNRRATSFAFSSGELSNFWPDWCGILSPSNRRADSFAFRAVDPQIGRDLPRIPTRPGTSVTGEIRNWRFLTAVGIFVGKIGAWGT